MKNCTENNKVKSTGILICEAGKEGEMMMLFKLQGLPNDYRLINAARGEKDLRLTHPDFPYEKGQQIDALVVGPQGVFIIENKHWSGKIKIDKNGKWVHFDTRNRPKNERMEAGEQINRHHRMVAYILGYDVPVIDIVCLTNPNIRQNISGIEYSNASIVFGVEKLNGFITTYGLKDGARALTQKEISRIAKILEEHRYGASESCRSYLDFQPLAV